MKEREYIDVLYEYAQDEKVQSYLETWECRRAVFDLEENWSEFRSRLTAEQGKWLDALLDQERKAGYLEEKAVFYSGLSIGVGLGRL